MPPDTSHRSAGASRGAPSHIAVGRRGRRSSSGLALAVTVALAAAVAGCGGDDTSATTEPATASSDAPVATTAASRASSPVPGTDRPADETAAAGQPVRTVETEMGPVEIPAQPQRIVALDEYAAMNMLALGVEPAVVWGSYNSEISQRVLAEAGIEVAEGSVATGIDFEAVAADGPDLIVLTAEPAFLESYEQLSAIAPTVVLPNDQPWRDAIRSTATTFDRSAEGDRLIGLLEGRIGDLAAEVQADPASISLLGNILEMLFAVSNQAPLSGLIDEVGLTRPAAQADGTPFEGYDSIIVLSSEVLAEHDADLVVVFAGNDYDAAAVTSLPTFQALPAVVDGRSFEVDGGMWFGTFPFAIAWILDDLTAMTGGEGRAGLGTVDDADARWADFRALIG